MSIPVQSVTLSQIKAQDRTWFPSFKRTCSGRSWKAHNGAFKVVYTRTGSFWRRRFYVVLPTGVESLVSDSLYIA